MIAIPPERTHEFAPTKLRIGKAIRKFLTGRFAVAAFVAGTGGSYAMFQRTSRRWRRSKYVRRKPTNATYAVVRRF